MIKTGLIGHGYWGTIIEKKLDELSDKRFVQTSKNYNPEVFNSVDWIFIATPADSHYHIAKECIQRKVNVFVEKPFCSTSVQAEELILLAKRNEVDLYVDNVFLLRSELLPIRTLQTNSMTFLWYKYGPFNDSLINDLLYHDLYILVHLMGYKKVNSLESVVNEKNILSFSFMYGDVAVCIDYNRNKLNIKKKTIVLRDLIVDFYDSSEDPLKKSIEMCINKDVDFNVNQNLHLATVSVMESIKQFLV